MIRRPYLVFLGDAPSKDMAKTGFGLRDWAGGQVIGQWRLPGCAVDLGLPEMDATQAAASGAGSLVIGVAPVGGQIPPHWLGALRTALEAGLDLVSGMHSRLTGFPELAETAARLGRALHDVRHSDRVFPTGNGRRRTGRRVLTVGTDCAVGKKYTALCLARGLAARGVHASFRATGQTGIMIAGDGVAIDAVIADFVSGAAEWLSPDAPPDHWHVVEGQGSLFHPAYAGVTLGLVHGTQPDALVLCHDPTRRTIASLPDYPQAPLTEAIDLYLRCARLTNPAARFVGVALNTSDYAEPEARALLAAAAGETGLPATDPLRFGVEPLLDRLLG